MDLSVSSLPPRKHTSSLDAFERTLQFPFPGSGAHAGAVIPLLLFLPFHQNAGFRVRGRLSFGHDRDLAMRWHHGDRDCLLKLKNRDGLESVEEIFIKWA